MGMAKKKGFEPKLRIPPGEHIPSHKGKRYEVVSAKSLGHGNDHLLGCGGSGEVYVAKDLDLNRLVAIKVFLPLYQLKLFPTSQSTSFVQDIEEEYRQEAQSLSRIKHRNIVTLFDTDTFSARDLRHKVPFSLQHKFHYTVTEFVSGKPLLDFLSVAGLETSAFLKILIQLCNALIYLHEVKQYLHCDVKSSNIIVEPESLDVTLLDFALTRNLNFSEVERTDTITFVGDWDIFPSLSSDNPLRRMMETRDPIASRAEFKDLAFPRLDIYHFGRLLQRCLELVPHVVCADDGFYLAQVTARCLDFEKTGWWYNTVRDLAYDIQKLLPDYQSPHRIRTLGASIRGEDVIQLPHHFHAVHFSGEMRAIIDSPQFQRLRTISQLDLCHFTFPGATHTRFLHSLHCYGLMGDFLVQLASDKIMRLFLSETFVNLAFAVALLHDIFHFPFLHVFEEIGLDSLSEGESLSPVDALLIADRDGISLSKVLEELKLNPTSVWGIIKGWPTVLADKEKRLIHGFIDGGVDLDKISYLFYDSYFTGVPDGVGLDINKLVRSSQVTRQGPYVLSWRASGLSPVEQVIMGRYQLFKKVYWNSVNRSAMARVKYAVTRLLAARKVTIDEYVTRTMFRNQSEALCMLNEVYKSGIDARSPLDGLIPPKRRVMFEVTSLNFRRFSDGF
jgi:HD superfamily phosphohydrolase